MQLQAENTEEWKGWTVTAEYSSEFTLAENPTNDPATITWGSEQFQRVVVVDKEGDAVVNSAGDPFDPPIMADDSRRVVTVTKNLNRYKALGLLSKVSETDLLVHIEPLVAGF